MDEGLKNVSCLAAAIFTTYLFLILDEQQLDSITAQWKGLGHHCDECNDWAWWPSGPSQELQGGTGVEADEHCGGSCDGPEEPLDGQRTTILEFF